MRSLARLVMGAFETVNRYEWALWTVMDNTRLMWRMSENQTTIVITFDASEKIGTNI